MKSTTSRHVGALFWRWVVASSLGWIIGLIVVIAIGLAWGLLGGEAQFMVGIGIGAGVGYTQGRALSAWLGAPYRWMMASTVGMGTLFVLHDSVSAIGLAVPYSLPLYVLAGAIATGLWQSSHLRHVSDRAHWWIAGSLLGWALPAASLALGDSQWAGVMKGYASLGAILFGGVMLGATSGLILVWILRRSKV